MDSSKRLRSADLMFLPPDIDKKNAPPSMEEQMAAHLNGSAASVPTLGAGGIRMARFAQPELDIDPDKPINADAIRKVDADIDNMRKILYRIVTSEFVQDDRVQAAFDMFLSRFRSACLDFMDRKDLGNHVSALYDPIVQLILDPTPRDPNEAAYLMLSENQMQILRSLCKKWALKRFKVYKLSYLVAGVMGFQEPRNLLIFNYIDTMMTDGIEYMRKLNTIDERNTLYTVMTALLKDDEGNAALRTAGGIDYVLQAISPYYDKKEVDNWEGVLSSALQSAVNQAYDFVRMNVHIRTKRNSSSRLVLRTRYGHHVKDDTLQKTVFFDEYLEKKSDYVSFNPELINLVVAYIPRNRSNQDSEKQNAVDLLNINKRQTELLLKLGLMGI